MWGILLILGGISIDVNGMLVKNLIKEFYNNGNVCCLESVCGGECLEFRIYRII